MVSGIEAASLIAKEIKLIGIKILGVEGSIVDIVPAVEIGQTT